MNAAGLLPAADLERSKDREVRKGSPLKSPLGLCKLSRGTSLAQPV